MATEQFARACAITGVVFLRKRASDCSTTSSRRKRKVWGWGSGLCVRSLSHMAAQSRPRMLRAEARGSPFLFRQRKELQNDDSKQHGIRDRRRRVREKQSGAATQLRR